MTQSSQSFLLGLSISILVLVSFLAGAAADRLFVIKPLNALLGTRVPLTASSNQASLLGSLLVEDGTVDVADIAEVASNAVVTVSVKREQRVISTPFTRDPFISPFFSLPQNTEVEQIQQDIGTGFVVESGLIVTNRHVVSDPNADYSVFDAQDREHQVTDIYRDPSNDLAILKIDGPALAELPLGDSDQLRVGQGVVAIGTALGEFRHTVTTGVVSGLGRGIEAGDGVSIESLEGVIQTDAAINPGNSGGPLVDLSGQVIGVSVAVSRGAENIGFAIPINVVKASIENFNATGQFDRAFLGVQYQIISEQAALFNEVPQGAYLVEVVEGSVAQESGLLAGDIITKFAGVVITEEGESLASLINQQPVGNSVDVEYWRGGQTTQVSVTLRGR